MNYYLFGFVSLIFFTIGFILAFGHLYILLKAKKAVGEVRAICLKEGTDGRKYYHGLIEYQYKGARYKFLSHPLTTFSMYIGDKVQLYYFDKGPQFVQNFDKNRIILGFGFLLISFIFQGILYFKNISFAPAFYSLFLILIFAIYKIRGKNTLIEALMGETKLEDDESLKSYKIYSDNVKGVIENYKLGKTGVVINIAFIFISLTLAGLCWYGAPDDQKLIALDFINGNLDIEAFIKIVKKGPLLGVIIGLSFLPFALVSLFFSRKKMNRYIEG